MIPEKETRYGMAVALILQFVIPADSLMQVTMNKSLAQVIQEQVSCRREFDEARSEFEQANTVDDPFARLNALDKLRRDVLLRCGVRP